MTVTDLAIHAYAHHHGPIWRSDAWAAPDHHLRIEAPAMPITSTPQTVHGVECYEAWRAGHDCPHEGLVSPDDVRDARLLAERTASERPGQLNLFGAAS